MAGKKDQKWLFKLVPYATSPFATCNCTWSVVMVLSISYDHSRQRTERCSSSCLFSSPGVFNAFFPGEETSTNDAASPTKFEKSRNDVACNITKSSRPANVEKFNQTIDDEDDVVNLKYFRLDGTCKLLTLNLTNSIAVRCFMQIWRMMRSYFPTCRALQSQRLEHQQRRYRTDTWQSQMRQMWVYHGLSEFLWEACQRSSQASVSLPVLELWKEVLSEVLLQKTFWANSRRHFYPVKRSEEGEAERRDHKK